MTETTTFEVAIPFRRFMVFGVLLFSAGFIGSMMLTFLPAFNQHAPMRWLWPVCSVCHAIFAGLTFSVLRMIGDAVEVSAEGISARRKHKPDIELKWEEIIDVENNLPARCLKLRSAGGRIVRAEYQFENFPELLRLLERNLSHIGNCSGREVFIKQASFYASHLFVLLFFGGFAVWGCVLGLYWSALMLLFTFPTLKAMLVEPTKVIIEPRQLHLQSVFRSQVIDIAEIRDIRLELAPQLLTLTIQPRGCDNSVKIAGFKKLFHLNQLIRHHHELILDQS